MFGLFKKKEPVKNDFTPVATPTLAYTDASDPCCVVEYWRDMPGNSPYFVTPVYIETDFGKAKRLMKENRELKKRLEYKTLLPKLEADNEKLKAELSGSQGESK
jgi:hypothetical protein